MIHHADIKEWAANYSGELFDGILCDPPYELGFMGKSWDSSGIAFDKDMWADLLKLLKPGDITSGNFKRGEAYPDKELTDSKGNSPYEGYGTALKPAHEPCVLARKPIEGTVANNVLKYGTGGLNIDGTRVGTSKRAPASPRKATTGIYNDYPEQNTDMDGFNTNIGRFPANLIHDGSDEVEAAFPNESSRFFYTAKASKSERNAGLEGFEDVAMGRNQSSLDGGKILTGSGNERSNTRQNHHPTVKPLSLTKYLATLIKPPTGGRLLVPFSGSGSEMIGALQAGWTEVVGVELTEEYIPIAEARIKYWLNQVEEESKQVALV